MRLSFGEAAGETIDVVLDGELEEAVEEDPNGSPMSLPLAAICRASGTLNRELVQSLASC